MFKKIWDLKIKKAWINYCLINTLEKANSFFRNNWFQKTIIKKNKNKVKLLINTIADKFLIEIVIINIILFAKIGEAMTKKIDTTNYNNHHSIVNNIINISKLVQLLIENNILEKQLG